MNKVYLAIAAIFISSFAFAQRSETLLREGWKFHRGDLEGAPAPDFDDSRWQTVAVPHDWAIYGPFSEFNDRQNVAIEQDGQQAPMEHAGRTGGLPFTGVGWYRTSFDVPDFDEKSNVTLLFDGAMSNAEVFVNGQKAGEWAYGYNSFALEVSPLINKDGRHNTLAVRLNNLPESSRWYPGAGLYRNVHLIATGEAYVPLWETQITTPEVSQRAAKVAMKVGVHFPEGFQKNDFYIETQVYKCENDHSQKIIFKGNLENMFSDKNVYEKEFVMTSPDLWSPENPALYMAVFTLKKSGRVIDTYQTRFGVRSIEIRPNDGFYLNGKKTKFQGVCNHHDLGALGAAVNDAAIRRQIRLLKAMGCNAIRTSHNMPAPELVSAADEMGMMIMAESFDEWKARKMKNGYNLYYDRWVERDLVNLVRRYRNSPSVVMWCIGNEVPDQTSKNGVQLARMMQDICHREDPTRPVTTGMDRAKNVINNNFAATMDVAGFNYRLQYYGEAYEKLPQQIVLGAETSSTVSSRGVYKFPVERKADAKYDDHQSSGYDVEHCNWSNLPDDDFINQQDRPYCIGEFVWTGFDYLGEPTPYYADWSSHSSLFGIIDLAGIPKDRYYLYKSVWNTQEKTLHVLPHWNWEGREGEITPIFVYTSFPTAEVFINGKSQGKRSKDLSVTLEGSESSEAQRNFERQKRYRLMWFDTKYEPGELRVVAYDSAGVAQMETTVRTAGKPHHIELTPDATTLKADGNDLLYINVRVVDKDGNPCPTDSREIQFSVSGAGTFRAAANGDPTCLYLFHEKRMPLFSGQLNAIVQAGKTPGNITFEAKAKGVKGAKINVSVQ